MGITFPVVPTITVKVSGKTNALLEETSVRRGVSKSKIVRDSLEKALRREAANPSLYDLMKEGIGCVDSGVTDLATNPKHLKGLGRWKR